MKKENMIFRLKLEITELVTEMVGKLPESLFISDSTTFLDPSMGGGQFVQAIESRLRKHGHSDDNIKNRVFGVEKSILRVNYAVNSRKLVGSYIVDNKDVPDIFMNMKFDAIVGNPPYQNGAKGSSGKLWMDFVEISIKSLKVDGYLCFVHPITWRSIGAKIWKEIYQIKQVEYVRIEPTVNWSADVKVDWYILRNSDYSHSTIVDFPNEQRRIDFRKEIGLNNSSVVEKLLKYPNKILVEQTHEFDTRRDYISDKKSSKFIFPIKNTGSSDLMWASKEHPWQNNKKVLLSRSGYLSPFYDEGKLGTTQDCYAIFVPSKKEGDYIIRLLNSKLFKFVQFNTKTSGFNDIKILNLLPYPKGLSESFTDSDLYSHFKLTNEEIKLIEYSVKN